MCLKGIIVNVSWVLRLGYRAVCLRNRGSIHCLGRLIFPRIQWKGHGSGESLLSKVQVKNEQRNTSTLHIPLWRSLEQHHLCPYKYTLCTFYRSLNTTADRTPTQDPTSRCVIVPVMSFESQRDPSIVTTDSNRLTCTTTSGH
jgi:hypothetical protein